MLIDQYKTLAPFAGGSELANVVSALPVLACYPESPRHLVQHRKYLLRVGAVRRVQCIVM